MNVRQNQDVCFVLRSVMSKNSKFVTKTRIIIWSLCLIAGYLFGEMIG